MNEKRPFRVKVTTFKASGKRNVSDTHEIMVSSCGSFQSRHPDDWLPYEGDVIRAVCALYEKRVDPGETLLLTDGRPNAQDLSGEFGARLVHGRDIMYFLANA